MRLLSTGCAFAAATLLCSCAADYQISVQNDTQLSLVPYPVVTTPPPPHREADPANTLAPGGTTEIDPTGFNLLLYEPNGKRSLTFQLALDDDPAQILVRTLKHTVEPGQEGGSSQPTVLANKMFEPGSKKLRFHITTGADTGLGIGLDEL